MRRTLLLLQTLLLLLVEVVVAGGPASLEAPSRAAGSGVQGLPNLGHLLLRPCAVRGMGWICAPRTRRRKVLRRVAVRTLMGSWPQTRWRKTPRTGGTGQMRRREREGRALAVLRSLTLRACRPGPGSQKSECDGSVREDE